MNTLFKISIRSQLMIIVAIVALPAAGIIIYSGIELRNHAINEARMNSQRLVDRIASEQLILATSARQLIVSLTQLPEVKEKNAAKANLLLSNIQKLNPNYTGIIIADNTGNVWASALPFVKPVTIFGRKIFKNAMESGQLSSGEFQIGPTSHKPNFDLGYPYKNNHGEIVGVIAVGIDLEYYKTLLHRTKLPPRASLTLIDHKGVVLFGSAAPVKHLGKQINPVLFKEMVEGPDANTTISAGIVDSPRQENYVSYQKLRLEGEQTPYMYVRVGIPAESVLSQARTHIINTLSMFTFVIALTLFLAWLVAKRSIVDRIVLLKRASRSLAKGNLQVRISDLVRGGELGELGEAFDAMALQLAAREESLSSSQRFLNTIIDTEPECVKLLDAEGRVLMMNRAGLKLVEAELSEQIEGQSIFPLITEQYRDAFKKLTNDVFQGMSGNLEFEWVGFKGGHVFLDTHVVPFRDDAGEIVSLLGITRDITDRKLADRALQRSEADLRKAQEIAKLGSWIYGTTEQISWSNEMYRIHGVSPETFMPTVESVVNLIHPDDRPAMQTWINAIVAGKKTKEWEGRVIWPDGTVHFISCHGDLVQDFKDKKTHLAGTAQDITLRKQAEEALAASESAFRATFEQAAVGMARVAPDGRWLQVNQRLCDIVGYTREELLALTFQEITHPDDLDADLDSARQLLAGEIDTRSIEKRYIRKNRSIVWVNLTVGLSRDTGGEPAYFICVVEDISQRKYTEEALAEKQRQLEDINKHLEQRIEDAVTDSRKKDQILIQQSRQAAMGEMINNIAHQWRQPLNTLALIVQELRMTYGRVEFSEEHLNDSVDKAMGLINNMSKTIDHFRNYFKPDKEKRLFDVNKAVSKTLALVEPTIQNLDINIEVIVTDDTSINGYENEYSQVLFNIILNCRDAFEACNVDNHGIITINIFKENNKSVVTIADNAGGIPEDVIDKIFDPYFTTKGPDKGTGIGLYMAKNIIEKNMGGRLAARNTKDGAEFRIEV